MTRALSTVHRGCHFHSPASVAHETPQISKVAGFNCPSELFGRCSTQLITPASPKASNMPALGTILLLHGSLAQIVTTPGPLHSFNFHNPGMKCPERLVKWYTISLVPVTTDTDNMFAPRSRNRETVEPRRLPIRKAYFFERPRPGWPPGRSPIRAMHCKSV